MALSYRELIDETAEFLGRADLEAQIPRFIRFAEAAFNRELRLKIMEREAWKMAVARQNSLPLPDRRLEGRWDVFLEMRDLRLDGASLKNLEFTSLDRIPEKRCSGRPCAYSIRGRELVFVPTPDRPYKVLMTYYAEIPPLGEKQPANELLLRHPDLYLYGALLASAAYTRSSAPLELWTAYYNKALDKCVKSDSSGRFTANYALSPIRGI